MKIYVYVILALSGCAINDETLSKPNGLVGQNNNNNIPYVAFNVNARVAL